MAENPDAIQIQIGMLARQLPQSFNVTFEIAAIAQIRISKVVISPRSPRCAESVNLVDDESQLSDRLLYCAGLETFWRLD